MADMKRDARLEEFLSYKGVFLDTFQSYSEDEIKKISAEFEDWKKANPNEASAEDNLSIPEAINLASAKKLDFMSFEEKVKVSNTLKSVSTMDADAKKAYDNIQKDIGKTINSYVNGKFEVDIDEVDNFLALINAYEGDGREFVAEEKRSDLVELLEKSNLTLEEYNAADDKTKDWIRKEIRSQYDAEVVAFLELNNIDINEYASTNKETRNWVKAEIEAQKEAELVTFLEANNITLEEYNVADNNTKNWVEKEMKAQYEVELNDYLAKNSITLDEYNTDKELQIMATQELEKERQLKALLAKHNVPLADYYSNVDKSTKNWADQEIEKAKEERSQKFKEKVQEKESNLDYRGPVQDTSLKGMAKARLNNFTNEYDDRYGLTGLDNTNSEYIDTNYTKLDGIGNEDLFAIAPFVEKPVEGMNLSKAKDIISNKSYAQLDVKEFASLLRTMVEYSGAFGEDVKYAVTKAARDKVLDAGKKGYSLSEDQLSSFALIHNVVSESAKKDPKLIKDKPLQKAKEKLTEGRETAKGLRATKAPEMQELYDMLSVIRVIDTKDGYEKVVVQKDEKGNFLKNSEIGLFIESVKEQTKREMLVGKEAINEANFKANFAVNLEAAIFDLYSVDRTLLRSKNHEHTIEKFINMAKDGKRTDILTSSFAGYAVSKNLETNSFLKRLAKKSGRNETVGKFQKNVDELDAKNDKAKGEKYSKTKRILKTIKKYAVPVATIVALGVVSKSAVLAAPVLAAYGVGNFAYQTIQIRKEFKRQKASEAREGRNLTFRDYMKNNPKRFLTAGLSAMTAAIPSVAVLGKLGVLSNLAATIAPQASTLMLGSAITGASVNVSSPIMTAIKRPNKKNIVNALKSVGLTAGFFMGGRAAANYIPAADLSNIEAGYENFMDGARDTLSNVGNSISSGFDNFVDGASNTASNIGDSISTGYNSFIDGVKNYFSPEAVQVDGVSGAAVSSTTLQSEFDYTKFLSNPLDINNNGVIDFMEGTEFYKTIYGAEGLYGPSVDYSADVNNNGLPDYLEPNNPEVNGQGVENAEKPDNTQTQETKATQQQSAPQESKPVVNNEAQSQPVEPKVLSEADISQLASENLASKEALIDAKQHTITNANGETISYKSGSDGYASVDAGDVGKIDGTYQEKIAQDIMTRVENGTATANDLKLLDRYGNDAMLAEAQAKYDVQKNEFLANETSKISSEQQATIASHSEQASSVKDNTISEEQLKSFANDHFEARETALGTQMHSITDSQGQDMKYRVNSEGFVEINGEKIVGHSELGNDISKDIMSRVENGTATANDIKGLEKYCSDKTLVAEAQAKYDSYKNEYLAEQVDHMKNQPVNNTEQTTANNGQASSGNTVVAESVANKMDISKGNLNISASFEDNGSYRVSSSGTIDIPAEVEAELSKGYRNTETGNVRVGNSVSPDFGVAKSQALNEVRGMIVENEVYSQLQAKENPTVGEKRFMETFEAKMEAKGYQRADDGHIQFSGSDKTVTHNSQHEAVVKNEPMLADNTTETKATEPVANNNNAEAQISTDRVVDAKGFTTTATEKGEVSFKIGNDGRLESGTKVSYQAISDEMAAHCKSVTFTEGRYVLADGTSTSSPQAAQIKANGIYEAVNREVGVYEHLKSADYPLSDSEKLYVEEFSKRLEAYKDQPVVANNNTNQTATTGQTHQVTAEAKQTSQQSNQTVTQTTQQTTQAKGGNVGGEVRETKSNSLSETAENVARTSYKVGKGLSQVNAVLRDLKYLTKF